MALLANIWDKSLLEFVTNATTETGRFADRLADITAKANFPEGLALLDFLLLALAWIKGNEGKRLGI